MKKYLLALTSILFSLPTFAGNGSKGGDIELSRKTDLQKYVAGDLKKDLAGYFSNLSLDVVPPNILTAIVVMREHNIQGDILLSPYSLENHCFDENKIERSAVTTQDIKGAKICLNLTRLVKLHVKKSELMGLLAHEHARHFGFEDQSPDDTQNPIQLFVAQTALKKAQEIPKVGSTTFEREDLTGTTISCTLQVEGAPTTSTFAALTRECHSNLPGTLPVRCSFEFEQSYLNPADSPAAKLDANDNRIRIEAALLFGRRGGWTRLIIPISIGLTPSNAVLNYLEKQGRLSELSDTHSALYNLLSVQTRLSEALSGLSLQIVVPVIQHDALSFEKASLECKGTLSTHPG